MWLAKCFTRIEKRRQDKIVKANKNEQSMVVQRGWAARDTCALASETDSCSAFRDTTPTVAVAEIKLLCIIVCTPLV